MADAGQYGMVSSCCWSLRDFPEWILKEVLYIQHVAYQEYRRGCKYCEQEQFMSHSNWCQSLQWVQKLYGLVSAELQPQNREF